MNIVLEKPSLYLDQVAAELFDRTGYSKERKKFVLTKKSYIHNNKPVGGKHSNDELMTQNRKKKQRELDRQKRVKLKEERLQERISLEFDKVQEEQRHIPPND